MTGLILLVTSSWRNPWPSFVLLPVGLIPQWVQSNLHGGQWEDWHWFNRRWFRIDGKAVCHNGGVFLLSTISCALKKEFSFCQTGQTCHSLSYIPMIFSVGKVEHGSLWFSPSFSCILFFFDWYWNSVTLSDFCCCFCISFWRVFFSLICKFVIFLYASCSFFWHPWFCMILCQDSRSELHLPSTSNNFHSWWWHLSVLNHCEPNAAISNV